jgi:DNA-binding response OmpR family regulator
MRRQLTGMSFDVLAASHYAAAVAQLASEPFDVACIDIGLPTESGYELCEYIRRRFGPALLPIVVTSDVRSPQSVAYAERAGADAFLEKPFSMLEFGASISALLGGAKPSPIEAPLGRCMTCAMATDAARASKSLPTNVAGLVKASEFRRSASDWQ